METAEFFDNGPGFGLGPVPLSDDLPHHESFLIDHDDHGDHPDLVGVDDFFLKNHENRQSDLDLFNNLPYPLLPLSVNDDRKDGNLVFFPLR